MSKTLNILNCQGATVGEYIVPDNAIEMSKGGTAVHDAVVAIRAGRRAGTACTKTRGLVRGGGAKIIYEPWHYRYVGTELSMELKDAGVCLEVYLDQLTEK